MTVNLSALAGAGQQFFDNNGNPLIGGKLYSYAAGTTTPKTTYTNITGLTAHTNPVVLDSAGRVATGEIWLTANETYKFVLKTSVDVTIATWDNITGINGTGLATNAELVEYDPPFTGALTSGYTVDEKLAQTVSVKDFGAIGDGVSNDTAAIQAALNYAQSRVLVTGNAFEVVLVNGTYLFNSKLTIYSNTVFGGSGTLVYSGSGVAMELENQSNNVYLYGFTVKCTSSTATIALYSKNSTRLNIQNVNFFGGTEVLTYPTARWSTAAINFDSEVPLNTYLLNVIGCKFQRIDGDCILYTGSGGSSVSNIRQCAFQANDSLGIHHKDGSAGTINIVGNEIEGFGSAAGSGMIKLGFVIGGVIEGNHFEHSSGSTQPVITIGNEIYANAVRISNNIIGGAGIAVTPSLIVVGTILNSSICNNYFAEATNAITVSTAFGTTDITSNGLAPGVTLINPATVEKIQFSDVLNSTDQTSYIQANLYYSGVISKSNSAQRGVMAVKPGDNGNLFQAKAGNTKSDFAVGDFVYNSAPSSGGYIGWVCTVAGRAHYYTIGTLTSGSNVVTSVGGAIWDWTVGDLICTDTNALGIPAGTTVTNIGTGTLTLSANATANGTGVQLFGARFKGFGLIES